MDYISLKYIGAGLMAIGMMGAAIGIGYIFSSLISNVARNPEMEEKLQRMAFIGAGLVEAMGLFSFIIAILLIFG